MKKRHRYIFGISKKQKNVRVVEEVFISCALKRKSNHCLVGPESSTQQGFNS